MRYSTSRLVYLLHFVPAFGRCHHYLGQTDPDRLYTRLDEHRRLRGASLTAAALRAGCSLYVATTILVDTPQDEARLKRAGHFKTFCPICNGREVRADLAAIPPLRWTRPPLSQPRPIDFPRKSQAL